MPLSARHANPIVFRIANHEARNVSYSDVVTLATRFGSSTASRSWAEIPEDGQTTREIDLEASQRHNEYMVSVVLEGRGDGIELYAVTQ